MVRSASDATTASMLPSVRSGNDIRPHGPSRQQDRSSRIVDRPGRNRCVALQRSRCLSDQSRRTHNPGRTSTHGPPIATADGSLRRSCARQSSPHERRRNPGNQHAGVPAPCPDPQLAYVRRSPSPGLLTCYVGRFPIAGESRQTRDLPGGGRTAPGRCARGGPDRRVHGQQPANF